MRIILYTNEKYKVNWNDHRERWNNKKVDCKYAHKMKNIPSYNKNKNSRNQWIDKV